MNSLHVEKIYTELISLLNNIQKNSNLSPEGQKMLTSALSVCSNLQRKHLEYIQLLTQMESTVEQSWETFLLKICGHMHDAGLDATQICRFMYLRGDVSMNQNISVIQSIFHLSYNDVLKIYLFISSLP